MASVVVGAPDGVLLLALVMVVLQVLMLLL